MIAAKMPNLVKGAGFAKPGGNKPLDDDGEIFNRSLQAEKALRAATKNGLANPDRVRKSLNPAFTNQFGNFLAAGSPANAGMSQFVENLNSVLSAELGKNITLSSPLSSGFVPFDLLAPSRLIYPVYSPLRNKIPRVPGQGTSHRTKVLTGIQGSQTSSVGAANRMSIGEFQSGGGIPGTNWPMNLPPSGAQVAVDLNIPYQFFGRSESISWLAQFAGQGFEDVSALANLILLQEFMLGEEYQMLSGTSASIAQPAAPTLVSRAIGTAETANASVASNAYFVVTAMTYFGETAFASANNASVASATWNNAGSVTDLTIAPVRGAYSYNVYGAVASAAPAAASAYHLIFGGASALSGVGATKITLQGVTSFAATQTPQAADSGTFSSTDYEGFLSILDGHAVTDAAVYPAGFTAGYINKSCLSTLNHEVLYNALSQLWNGRNSASAGAGNTSTAGAYRADPAELIVEGSDVARLSDELIQAGTNAAAYRIFVDQTQVDGIRSGAAVSEFQNPITRSVVKLVVHPWLTQGTAFLMSYTLPMSWTNVANVFENVMVQDYLSVSWPVIDASFRYSMFMYGALVAYAPQYCGVLQGLQVNNAAPWS
jgi:hypothetical protein